MFTSSYFNTYNIILNAQYIVYLDKDKYNRAQTQSRETINNFTNDIELEKVYHLFDQSSKVAVISQTDEFHSFYDKKLIQKIAKKFDCPDLLSMHGHTGSEIYIIKNTKNIQNLISFCVHQLNDIILVDLETKKVFISYNSYYLTNIITPFEMQHFPITKISDQEIKDRIYYDFQESIDDTSIEFNE